MITYQCRKCGTALESPDGMAGKADNCPVCGVVNTVPRRRLRYKCPQCRASLDNSDDMGGKEDVCPKCGRKHRVPLTAEQKVQEKLRLRSERERHRRAKDREAEQQVAELRHMRQVGTNQAGPETVSAQPANTIIPSPSHVQPPPMPEPAEVSVGAQQAQPRLPKKTRSKWNIGLGGGVLALIVVAVVVYGLSRAGKLAAVSTSLNPSELQNPMDRLLEEDHRNTGMRVSVYYSSPIDSSVVMYDLRDVPGSCSRADVFRVLLQFADRMQHKHFNEVRLCYQGKLKFTIPGSYFSRIGREYTSQNPVYTMRTFPENLLTKDGHRAYPEWEGGVFGVLERQMRDFNGFHDKWYLDDMRYK